MTKAFILIFVVFTRYAGAPAVVEFTTMEACESAGAALMERFSDYRSAEFVCVEKGA